jgi:CrcB protein
MNILAVIIGGSLGALLRYAAMLWWHTERFPFGTLIVNVVAALLVGILYVVLVEHLDLLLAKNLLIVGFLGALSTMSALSLETWLMIDKGEWIMGISYVIATNLAVLLVAGSAIFTTRYVLTIT